MEIHRADPAYRRRSLLLLAATAGVCALALWQLHGWLQDVIAHLRISDADEVRRWLRALLTGLAAVPVVPLAFWGRGLRRLARATREEQRFPPKAWKTYRDVRVLRAHYAQTWAARVDRLGRAAQTLAGVLAAAAVVTWWYFS